ncbi:MAG: tripartite tricarboxylate transporter TctB family protein [Pseudomonadota bacterium]
MARRSAGDAPGPGGARAAGPGADAALGAAIAALGAVLLVWAIPAQVNDAGSFGLPPSLAPRVLAWLMVGLGLVLIAQDLRRVGPDPLAGRLTVWDMGHLALCIGSVALMLVAMRIAGQMIGAPYSGFWCAAPLGLVAFTLIHGRAPLWAYAFNAVAAPAAIYAGFWWGLGLPLP